MVHRAVRDLIGGGLWPQAVHLDSDLPHARSRAH
jgi:hypothetical protein